MILILIAVGVLVFVAGLGLGWALGVSHTVEEYTETLERIDPGSRTPGQPTNLSADPARVTEPKRRPGHFMS